MLELLLYAWIASALVMTLVWAIQLKTKNAGIVDAFWSWNFPIIALIYYFFSDGNHDRAVICLIIVSLWGLRLGTYLFLRTIGHHDKEDVRYAKLREENRPNENRYFFFFFQIQAITNVILSIPFLFPMMNPDPELTAFEFTGIAFFAIGLIGETLADFQLSKFKKDPGNKGKVFDSGLWSYSRHPNYFFEFIIWVGFAVFASGSPYGWTSIFAPALILFLLMKVSGIPMTEELAVKTKGQAYLDYQRRTSAFFPWFKKKNA